MSFRTKSRATVTKHSSAHQVLESVRLSKIVNFRCGGLPFQSHNAIALLWSLKHQLPEVYENFQQNPGLISCIPFVCPTFASEYLKRSSVLCPTIKAQTEALRTQLRDLEAARAADGAISTNNSGSTTTTSGFDTGALSFRAHDLRAMKDVPELSSTPELHAVSLPSVAYNLEGPISETNPELFDSRRILPLRVFYDEANGDVMPTRPLIQNMEPEPAAKGKADADILASIQPNQQQKGAHKAAASGSAAAATSNSSTTPLLNDISKFSSASDPLVLPRDGLHGHFFQREEIVDALMAASRALKLKNPFWLRAGLEQQGGHPQLGKYLTLKPDSVVVEVPLTAMVFPVSEVCEIPSNLIHHSIELTAVPTGSMLSTAECPPCRPLGGALLPTHPVPGTNLLTGFVSKNPFFRTPQMQNRGNRGMWLSLDQILSQNLKFKDMVVVAPQPSPSAGQNASTQAVDGGVPPPTLHRSSLLASLDALYAFIFATGKLVEIERWELYNAESLAVPGRLSLKKAAWTEMRESLASQADPPLFE